MMKSKRIRVLYLVEGRDGRADPGWDAYCSKRAAEEGAKQNNVGDHSIRKFVPVGSQLATRSASGPKNRRFSPLTLTEFDAIADGLDLDVGSEREKFIARFNRVTDPADETIGIRAVESVTDTTPMAFDEFEAVADGIDLSNVGGRKKFFKALGVFQVESAFPLVEYSPAVYVVPGPRELYEAYGKTLGGDAVQKPWESTGMGSVQRYTYMSRILQEGVDNKAAFVKTVPKGNAPTVKHGPLNLRELRTMAGERLTEGTHSTGWIHLVDALNKRFASWANSLPTKDCGHVQACPLTVVALKTYAVPQFVYMESKFDTGASNIDEEEEEAWRELVDQINAHFENTRRPASFQSTQAFVKPGSYHAELLINGVSVVTTALDISASDKLEVNIRTHRSAGERNEADDFDVQRIKNKSELRGGQEFKNIATGELRTVIHVAVAGSGNGVAWQNEDGTKGGDLATVFIETHLLRP